MSTQCHLEASVREGTHGAPPLPSVCTQCGGTLEGQGSPPGKLIQGHGYLTFIQGQTGKRNSPERLQPRKPPPALSAYPQDPSQETVWPPASLSRGLGQKHSAASRSLCQFVWRRDSECMAYLGSLRFPKVSLRNSLGSSYSEVWLGFTTASAFLIPRDTPPSGWLLGAMYCL